MEGSNGVSNSGKFSHSTSTQMLFRPMSQLPCFSPAYANCAPTVSEGNQNPLDRQPPVHQRFSSESFAMEEQPPPWLEELLDDPEVPHVPKGHRRYASDSSAYLDVALETFNMREEYMSPNAAIRSPWSSQNFVHPRYPKLASFKPNTSFINERCNWTGAALLDFAVSSTTKDGPRFKDSIPRNDLPADQLISAPTEKNEQDGSGEQKRESAGERNDCSEANTSASKAEAKRAKQNSAHRSRVRKLQYIAELERNVHVLQAEGSEILAELEFLDQRNLILGMENRALRQRLDSISQEQLIRHMEHDMLEKELLRLQVLYQLQRQELQQQQQQKRQHQHQQHSKHRRTKSRDSICSTKNKEGSSSSDSQKDLESHFASLSSRPREASSSCGSLNSSLCM